MNKVHPTPPKNNRIGFHYFPDTFHYRESDLIAWLPELVALGTKWLVLETPLDRAIPEDFIKPLISAGIEPVLNMRLSLSSPPSAEDLSVLLEAYSHWGVNYISLFDRPNTLESWTEGIWVQQKLVEHFLNVFIPLAETICAAGLTPIFPALEPGGNFWDTAFLRSSLQGIQARQHTRLLSHMVIGAYAWPNNRSLNWGAGGPEMWPGARPYDTPETQQDQCGFRIFDWYSAISESVLGTRLPMILLGTGTCIKNHKDLDQCTTELNTHTETNFQIAKLLAGENTAFRTPETAYPIPEYILAGCFTYLVESHMFPQRHKSWYSPDGEVLPIVQKMKDWQTHRKMSRSDSTMRQPIHDQKSVSSNIKKPIKHYLLLPHYEWGGAAWYLEASQPYIQKYSPTIGFSIKEAFLAEKVTVVGGVHAFPDQLIPELEKNGSTVVQITGNGTDIATQLTIK